MPIAIAVASRGITTVHTAEILPRTGDAIVFSRTTVFQGFSVLFKATIGHLSLFA